jgi:hypothetical protein
MTPTCPACEQSYDGHPWCVRCRCFHHMPARYDPAICQGCDALLAKRGLRRCRECGIVKPLAASFGLLRNGVRRRACYVCRRRALPRPATKPRRLTEAQRQAKRAAERAWRARNPERARAIQQRAARKYAPRRAERERLRRRAYTPAQRARQQANARARYQRRKLAAFWGTR